MAQLALRRSLSTAKLPSPGPVPLPYPTGSASIPPGLNPAGFKLAGSNSVSFNPAGSRQANHLGSNSAGSGGNLPKGSPAGPSSNRTVYQVTGSLTYYAAKIDLGSAYPDVPMGGSLNDVLQFAWTHTLPVFRFVYLPMEMAVVVYCWVEVVIGLMPLAFVYVDASLRNSPVGISDFFVYQWLLNMPTQLSPLTIHGGSNGLCLLSPPDALWVPFVPPAPFWPQGDVFPPNPYMLPFRGGNVPCDASGLSALAGAFV